jgi:hypothetical protein
MHPVLRYAIARKREKELDECFPAFKKLIQLLEKANCQVERNSPGYLQVTYTFKESDNED